MGTMIPTEKTLSRSLNLDVVAQAAIENVDPNPADEHIVAIPTEENVVAFASDEHIVTFATVGRQLDCTVNQTGSIDHIVSGQGVDNETIICGFRTGDVDSYSKAENARPIRVTHHGSDIISICAGDDYRVGLP